MEYLSASVLKVAALPHGVPQGSYCFTIYARKLFETAKAHLPDVHAYADDTHLYLSFMPDSEDNQTEAVDAGQECIKDIRAWMAADQLKLNEDKTEVILIGTQQ